MSNGRQVVRARPQAMMPVPPSRPVGRATTPPPVGTRSGKWTWDGTQWVCVPCPPDDCDDFQPPFPCPPVPGFAPWFDPTSAPWYPGANAGVSFGQVGMFPSFPIRGNFFWDGHRLWMFDGAAWVDIVASAAGVPPGTTPPPGTGSGGVTISTNPPGNPFLGQQWWNGSQLHVWDGGEWQVVGPGAAAGPVPTTTQVFSIGAPTNIALPGTAGTWQIIPFNVTPTVDPMTGYDPVTHKFMPNKAGFYQWMLRGQASPSTAIAVVRNDSGTYTGNSAAEDTSALVSGSSGWMMAGGISLMNGTTDYVRCFAKDSNGVLTNTGSNPMFRAYLLP